MEDNHPSTKTIILSAIQITIKFLFSNKTKSIIIENVKPIKFSQGIHS